MPPLITVLITTYNYGRFIGQAIDSVLSQGFGIDGIQILVVDDGSADDTSERVRKYGSRVEYLHKPNGGQASALNFGIARARGEVIALLDADDLCLPGRLTRIATAFEHDASLGMVYHRLQEWHVESGERREAVFLPLSGDAKGVPDFFLRYLPMATSCIAYRRVSLEPFLPIPENIRMLADGYLTMLMPFVSPVLAIPELLSVYRVHGKNSYYANDSQMPAQIRLGRLEQWRVLMDAMRDWLAKSGFSRKQDAVGHFLDRWALYLESERFQAEPPGRFRYFRHLRAYNSCYRSQMSRRLHLINHINAFGSLLVGYRHFHLLEEWRSRWTNMLGMQRT